MKVNQFQRILALLLAVVLTVCLLPAAAFAAEADDTPTEIAQSATDPPTESTEPAEIPGDPTEGTVPPVTEPEETIPPDTDPADTTSPAETDPTEPQGETEPSESTETTEPPEEMIPPTEDPSEPVTDPEETDGALHIGDELTPYSAVMPLTLDPGTVLTITDEIAWYCGNTSYDWHSEEYGKYGTFWTETAVYFKLSDGSIGFCTQPQKKGVTGDFAPTGWYKWIDAKAQQGIALILAYGAPNNGDTSEEGIKATALAVWDMATGYRYPDGSLRGYGTPPFYRNCSGVIREKYDAILAKLAQHGTIPSFTVQQQSQIGDAQTIILKRDAASGLYMGSAVDTNGVLADFNFTSTIPGLTFTKSGNTLLVEATEAAAKQLSAGVTIRNRGQGVEVGPNSCTILSSVDYGADKQLVVVLDAPTDPVPCYFRLEAENPAEKLTLRKSINASPECIAQLQGNAMYSLAGAQYVIKLNGVVQETVTTNANGEAVTSKSYNIGDSLTYQETAAPPGFKLDRTIYTYTVVAGENIISVKDEPVLDPPFAITKVDKATADPQGNASFSGAIFKWEYYDNASWSGTPKRTWYFKTDVNGMARYSPSFFASDYSNDALYIGASGAYQVPLGTVKITEIKNSLGYIVLPQPLYCSVAADPDAPDGAKVVWQAESWNVLVDMASGNFGVYEPIDESLFGSLTIQKEDKDTGFTAPGWAAFAGCEFTVYNRSKNAVKIGDSIVQPGGVCCVLTVDETGRVSTGNIFPLGTYEARETKGNDYYELNSSWSFSFTVDGLSDSPTFTVSCPNALRPGKISIHKVDPSGNPLAGAKFLLEWSEDGAVWHPVTHNANADVVKGGTSSGVTDGCLTSGKDGLVEFTGLYPTLRYRLTEVEAPNGYLLLPDTAWEGQLPVEDLTVTLTVHNSPGYTLPDGGSTAGRLLPLMGLGLFALALCLGIFGINGKAVDIKHFTERKNKQQ